MSKTIDQIREELNQKIPRDAVMQREGSGGKSFSYLAGHYVIDRMNQVFGQGNWSYLTEECKCVHSGAIEAYGKTTHTVHYIAKVAVQVKIGELVSTFSDVGYGDGSDKTNIGKAHELAAKEAATDALKRACKNLGMSMGLALYSKDQENVADEDEAPKAVAQAAPKAAPISKRAPEPTGPAGVGQGAGESKPAISAAASGAVEESREQINELISKMSKVIIAKKTKTLQDIKGEMKAKYGTDKKEDLTDAQAKELYAYLKGVMG